MDSSRNAEGSHKSGQPEDNPEIMTNQAVDTSIATSSNTSVKLHINDFPSEILLKIFWFLDTDDSALLSAEATCTRWKMEIESSRMYVKKCRRILALDPGLGPTFAQHKFEDLISSDFSKTKRFYFKLRHLSKRWNCKPRVTVIDCLQAEVNGKKMEVSDDWFRRHNYTGFYDLVWLPNSNHLVISVYDSIQVWDMSTYSCVNIIGGNILDGVGLKSWCFHAFGETLFCGTNKGQIRVIDLMTGVMTGTFRHPQNMAFRNYICDLKVRGEDLLAIDWIGTVQHWKVPPDRELIFISSFVPASNDAATLTQYTSKQTERLIEFNDVIGVTNVRQLFCIWDMKNRERVAEWIATGTYVLCSKVLGRDAFWGEQNGSVHQFHFPKSYAGNMSSNNETGYVQTTFKDSITSLSVTSEHVLFGDKNGEIHCANVPLSMKNGFKFILETGHQFGAFVWAIQVDGVRIFSGDSNAKMVIHDFWDFGDDEKIDEAKTEVIDEQPTKKLKQ